MIIRPSFCSKDTKQKNKGLLFVFNSLKQKKLILNFFLFFNVTDEKKADSRKRAQTDFSR